MFEKDKFSNFSFKQYSNFKILLNEKIKQLITFTNKEKEIELQNMIEDKDNLSEYLFFINYKQLININFDYSINNNDLILLEELKNYKIYNDKSFFNDKIFKMIFHLYLYLIINLDKEIINISQNNSDEIINNVKKNINEYYYLFEQIIFLLAKLYFENIYTLKKLIFFLDILNFFINKNDTIINDKYAKLKAIIFFELLFNLYRKILYILLKINKNKEDILDFLNYLTKNLDDLIKSVFNSSILANNKILQKLMLTLLNNLNFSRLLHEDIYNICNISIIDSFTSIYGKSINKSDFFEILINQNKESFINLSNFLKNKEKIINDIYKQNFYISLLNNMFKKEKLLNNKNSDSNNFFPPKNSFIYNGYNSKMTFKLNKIQLDNSIIFFSFQLSNEINNKNCNIPILIFENEITNKLLFKLYIKHTFNNETNKFENKLYIYQEKNKDFILDKIENIFPNTNYYSALYFKSKKLYIFLRSVNNQKENKYSQILELSHINDLQINFKIGHNDNEKEYFKGFIGSFFLIKKLTLQTNEIKYDYIINVILKLKDFYKYFPYFFSKSTNYNFDNILSYHQMRDSDSFNKIQNHLQKHIKEFECYLYLTPEIINLCYSLMDKNIPFAYLPNIPDICEYQQYYVILDMNISLTNIDSINEEFLTNNGFNYICLIYEYFYQFSNLYILNKKEFDDNSIEQKIKKVITNTISKTILLLENYNKCIYIINFECSLKKMFKNLYECLKNLNKIWNILSEDIISNLYELVFSYKDNAIMNYEQKSLYEYDLKNKVLPFCEGLIDILFDIELYKNCGEDNSIEILFLFVSSFLSTYIKSLNDKKTLPFKLDFLWKIINFTQIIGNFFTLDYKKVNPTISSFFNLIENYFIAIKDKNNSLFYFKHLLNYCLVNYQNNLIVTYNFLCFIHEMLWKGYSLENEEILQLFEFCNKYKEFYSENKDNNDEKINDKLMNELFSVIARILVDLIFNKDSKSVIDEVNKNLNIFSFNQIILVGVTNEIIKIIEGLIKNGFSVCHKTKKNFQIKFNKGSISNHMKFYWNIFYFIILLLKNLISVKENNSKEAPKENKIIYEIKNNINFYNLYSLLVNIEGILRDKSYKNVKNIHCVCCLVNFIKFYHYIIFNEKNILRFLDKAFIDNLLQIINLCSKFYYLTNFNRLFKIIIGDYEYNKTIIEIIIEIYIKYFLNNINSEDCYKSLLSSHSIFYDIEFEKDKKYTIFYVNDFYRYAIDSMNINEQKNKNIVKKCKVLLKYNEYFNDIEDKFELNFTTYFLLKIFDYKKDLDNNNNSLINELKKIINILFLNILKEHIYLKDLGNKYFFKINSSLHCYNELIKLIKNQYIPKKMDCLKEINKFLENNSQQMIEKKHKDSISLSDDKEKKENEKEKKVSSKNIIEKKDSEKNNKNKENNNNNNEEDELKKSINKTINISDKSFQRKMNKISYFNNFDKFFLKNVKKEIMNNIFSLYYIDVFYFNKGFCRMRDYFINRFLDDSNIYTKQLNYPSKIKNFSNNLEPPLFIKQYNDFFNNPIFPISHSYAIDKINIFKKNDRTIKLIRKKIPVTHSEITKIFECEYIRLDNYYFGKILINESADYFLFNEKEVILDDLEKDYKYMFFLSYYFGYEQKKNVYSQGSKQYVKARDKKNILIVIDEIEEIVERRILLMWKAVEIFLKNGKSYFFNFLSTSEFENFLNFFKNLNTTKNIIRKRDFCREEKNISNQWEKGLINNYEYLLLLNKYSSRSFNDTNQYPVFPWLLNTFMNLELFNKKEKIFEKALIEHINLKNEKDELYINNKNNMIINSNKHTNSAKIMKEIKDFIRNFKYPISLQKKEKRDKVMKKYSDEENEGEFPNHSGCHYSTSAYIYYYLMRQEPFCELIIKLQGYNLENTNRCFISLKTIEFIIENGCDNRELIPELFSKIEYFLNLNCANFGYLVPNNNILDDAIMDNFKDYKINHKYPLSIYVYFILQHKKMLNSKIIGYYINKWIDNIFGIKQFPPEKSRNESCNIFHKLSYEQKINLEKKLLKFINEKNLNQTKIYQKLILKINRIINFGQTPYQIFSEKHQKLNLNIRDLNKNEKNNKNNNDILEDEEDDEDNDFESLISNSIRDQNLKLQINGIPFFFQINPSIDKIFIYNNKENLIILNSQLYNKTDSTHYDLSEILTIEKSNILLYGLIHGKYQYLLYKLNYAFSSFDFYEQTNNSNLINSFHTYYTEVINDFKKKTKTEDKPNGENRKKYQKEMFFLITCRHIDYSFKIFFFKKKNKKYIYKKFSYLCEDFVTSCCSVSGNQFILGLKNGKLLFYSIELILNENDIKNTKNKKEDNIFLDTIIIRKERYVQGHHGKINVIEIDKRIGVVITSGDDNYILIRKLYDFELLLPIKIKSKYTILNCKISTFNFLYILCYNKIKNKSVIFGYTLCGLKFAKSDYGLYDNICFTGNGNLVTMNNGKEITVLSGHKLRKINMDGDKETMEAVNEINKVNGANWIHFDCFLRKFEYDISKIVTYFSTNQKNIYSIKTLNVKNIKCFD